MKKSSQKYLSKLFLFLCTAMLAGALTGCSNGGTGSTENTSIGNGVSAEINVASVDPDDLELAPYKAIRKDITLPDDLYGDNVALRYGLLHYVYFDFDNLIQYIKTFDPQNGKAEELFTSENGTEESLTVSGLYLSEECNTTVLCNTGTYGTSSDAILKEYDPEGNLTGRLKLNTASGDYLYKVCKAGNDRIFVYGTFSGNQSTVKECNPVSGDLSDPAGLPKGFIFTIGPDRDTGALLIGTQDYVYRYDPTTESATPILEWQSVDLEGNKVCAMEMTGGMFQVMTRDYSTDTAEFTILAEKDAVIATEDDPTEIRIVTTFQSDSLKSAVAEFNKSQSEYRVSVKTYQLNSPQLSTEDDVNRILADLLSSDPPDLLDINSFDSYGPSFEDLLREEYVEDLTPYIAESDLISLADFEPKALSLGMVGDALLAIPYSFDLWTCLVDGSEDWGKEISASDIIAYDLSHPEKSLFEGANQYTALNLLLYRNLDAFVDPENGTCDFENETFRSIVEYAKNYTSNDGNWSFGNPTADTDILSWNILSYPQMVQTAPAQSFHGNGVFAGMPTLDGHFRTLMEIDVNNAALAITCRSAYKEGAWKFLEYYVSREPSLTGTWISLYGIPSKLSLQEKYLDRLAEKDGPMSELDVTSGSGDNQVIIKRHPFTEEDRTELRRLIDGAEPDPADSMSSVIEILVEELDPYFADQKSLEDVMDIIQSRVKLYLTENYG